MVEVNEALTRKVAELSRLELTDAEVTTFTAQLGDILKYVEQLSEVKVDGVEPLTQPLELETAYREDVARPFGPDAEGASRILKSAPDVVQDGFKVPQIV